MTNDVIVEYLNSGMMASENYKKCMLSSGPLVILGILPGIFLKSYWLNIAIVMLLTFVICLCIAFRLMSKELTLKRRIQIEATIFTCWYLQFGGAGAILFILEYGINYKLSFLYLPSLLFCLFLLILTSAQLRSGKFTVKKNSSIKGSAIGVSVGLVGWRCGRLLFNGSTEDVAAPIALLCFTVVHTLLAVGFLNFQKLYYLHKLERPIE